ncbi:hybrid sensor histidine kinase/response regulator [Desulfonatronovibrio magnus]|uniref:hybrid sensor histidine kinase/response regulator n=1 Tax=Desulfonatronovibrio magnus TaxID=698827 RepID=UPI0005EB049D|nr:PAS domain-containing sensor histidine kinase [Desulfonatronovibrio magnus]
MDGDKSSPLQSIFVRMIVPLLLGLLVISFWLQSLVVGTVDDFLDRHMREKMHWMMDSIYDICDGNLNDFLLITSGSHLNYTIVQARTMSEIEIYLESQQLSGAIFTGSGQAVMSFNTTKEDKTIYDFFQDLPAISVSTLKGSDYLTGRLHFELWDWDIYIMQDTQYYESMLGHIKAVYWGVLSILGAGVLLIMLLIIVNVSAPLSKIISRLKNEESPDYKGVAEFTYLSRTIEGMMNSIKSKNQFISNLFEIISIIIVVVDKNGRVAMANNYLCSLSGFSRDEIVGKGLWEIVPKRRSKFIKKLFEHHKTGFTVNGEEMSILTRSGKKLHILWYSRHFTDNESGQDWMIYTGSDISRLKQTEKSLEKERMLIYSLFDSSPLAQMVVGNSGEILDVNQQFFQLTGYKRSDVHELGSWLARITEDPEDLECLRKDWINAASGQTVTRMVGIKDRSGSHKKVELSFSALPDGRVVSFLMDMTQKELQAAENRKMEQELHQARKMEALGVLAGGIAHDFNNILQAVSGQVQLMNARHEDHGIQRFLKRISALVDRGVSLVKRIMAFSRKMEPQLSQVNLNDLVLQEMEILRHALPKMINLTHDLDSDISEVLIDRHQIELVLMNLIKNAGDAIDGSGDIIVRTEQVNIDNVKALSSPCRDVAPGRYVALSVSDTGAGMDEKIRERMYDPFYTTKELGKGTGLGLPTVFGIIKEHNGYIFCHSEVGSGTKFTILLPASKQQKPSEQDLDYEIIKVSSGNAPTIMVVDDEADIREITVDMFEHYGFKVLDAGSGEEAIDIFSSHDIDVIVMDLGMPGMGGEQCAREILKIDPDARIIIASGYMDHPMSRDPGSHGLLDFVAKPYQVQELVTKIRLALDIDNG